MGKNRFIVVEFNMKVCMKSEIRKVEVIMVNGRLFYIVFIGNLYFDDFLFLRGMKRNF